jgi:hypothetical protein
MRDYRIKTAFEFGRFFILGKDSSPSVYSALNSNKQLATFSFLSREFYRND